MNATTSQLELFAHVSAAYADSSNGRLTNAELYEVVADKAGIPRSERTRRTRVGNSGQEHNLFHRALRWHQQTLKQIGVLTHGDERGVWELAQTNKKGLHNPLAGVRLVAFNTKLGFAIWGDAMDTFCALDEPIALAITSPPYLLRKARAYGNPTPAEYVDFITAALEPIVRKLVPGGSICINIGQDCFEEGSPARSMINERVLIALHDRLGLHLMDRLIWHNPSKAPGPIQWASKTRQQLNTAWEPIYWLSPSPKLVRADNRRVLEPHSAKHVRLMESGGEKRDASYADGAYVLRPGKFGKVTEGRIPRNVLTRGHRCADTLQYRRDAQRLRLPVHGAKFPISIPEFLIRFLSEPGDLVVDCFGGSGTTAIAAEQLGRRWLITDNVLEYLRGGAERFRSFDGFYMPDRVEQWPMAA